MTSARYDTRPVGSCVDCFAWGPLWWYGRCTACYAFRRLHHEGRCRGCRRHIAVKQGYCRLCWREAHRRANIDRITTGTGIPHCGPLAPFLEQIDGHQLVFANTDVSLWTPSSKAKQSKRRVVPAPEPFTPPPGPGQTTVFTIPRDLTRFRRPSTHEEWLTCALALPHVARAWHAAQFRADAHGWTPRLLGEVRRTLITALCCRPADEPVRYSELLPLAAARSLPVERTAQLLAELGMLHDDRLSPLEKAFDRRLSHVSPTIRTPVEDWIRQLLNGIKRSRPRTWETVMEYLRSVSPVLTRWSHTHDHLREITPDHVREALAALPSSSARTQALISLRSLFRHLRAQRLIFKNPTLRLAPGTVRLPPILPLSPTDYQQVIAAATTPEHRLTLALAAVHAARPSDIRALQLDDVDLGDRLITIAGHDRRLDDLTHKAIRRYLDLRRKRWPNTANPHLLVSARTAYDTRPVTGYYLSNLFRGHNATLDRLRADRWLDEALDRGPDPLHLAAVFGISAATAIRYANSARSILEGAAHRE
ncbi:site-specific integrase [Streptomyces sp. NPDC093084]|uniref:tyrosine-type recombinase/integrase n=1 Tax=Streptomyces sp. NPDC093084 TaxID=3155197 RepID=UPI00343006DF